MNLNDIRLLIFISIYVLNLSSVQGNSIARRFSLFERMTNDRFSQDKIRQLTMKQQHR